jgi:hypothetical protein
MGQYVAFDTESGSILVETSAPGAAAVTRSGSDRLVVESATRLVDVIGAVRPAAEALVDTFRAMRESPDELAISFGVSITAAGKLVIVSGGTEAIFSVSLRWNRPNSRQPATP